MNLQPLFEQKTMAVIGVSLSNDRHPASIIYNKAHLHYPLEDATSMLKGLKAHQILEGYRGADPINVEQLTRLLITFSELVMQIEPYVETIDLNPVMCSAAQFVVGDARIILNG